MQHQKNQQECIAGISEAVNSIFDKLLDIEKVVKEIFQLRDQKLSRVTSKDFSTLKPILDQHLKDDKIALQGVGIVLEPSVFEDNKMYLEWRQISPDGSTFPLYLNFNCSSDVYYDYLEMPWFYKPSQDGNKIVEGPYIDLYGQDMYLLTFAVPIHIKNKFVGIAGADIALSKFESKILKFLLELESEAALMSEHGRVIAANSSNYISGELISFKDGQAESIELNCQGIKWSILQRI